jgi:hypothetical protein
LQSARVSELIAARWHESMIVGVRFADGLRVAGLVLIGLTARLLAITGRTAQGPVQ